MPAANSPMLEIPIILPETNLGRVGASFEAPLRGMRFSLINLALLIVATYIRGEAYTHSAGS